MIVYQALRWYWGGTGADDNFEQDSYNEFGAPEPGELSTLNRQFESACDKVRENVDKLPHSVALTLYGLYKRATVGRAGNENKPSRLDLMKRRQFDAWLAVNDLSETAAKEQYIFIVQKHLGSVDEQTPGCSRAGFGMRPSVPLQNESEPEDEWLTPETREWFDTVYGQDLSSIGRLLKCNPHLINMRNGDGLSALHYATDRGHLDLIDFLITRGADVNCVDDEGQTPLHYASECGHKDAVIKLLSAGADPTIATREGQCPLDVAYDPSIRKLLKNALRRS